MVKASAQDLIKDRTLCSAYGYCKRTHSEFLRSSLDRIMRKDPALVDAMKGKNRVDFSRVSKALDTLDRLVPSIAEEHASNKEPPSNKEPASNEEPASDEESTIDEESAIDEEPASTKAPVIDEEPASCGRRVRSPEEAM